MTPKPPIEQFPAPQYRRSQTNIRLLLNKTTRCRAVYHAAVLLRVITRQLPEQEFYSLPETRNNSGPASTLYVDVLLSNPSECLAAVSTQAGTAFLLVTVSGLLSGRYHSIQRQQLGTAMPFEVFQAQEIYLRARLDYLKAIASYNNSQYSLYVALGNNL